MRKIESCELVDHGIEGSQYFRGCGVAYTPYTDVVTGIGDNPAEAIEDCLEQIAMGHDVDTDDLETRIKEEEEWNEYPVQPSVCGQCEHHNGDDEATRCDGCELHYMVSIRWR